MALVQSVRARLNSVRSWALAAFAGLLVSLVAATTPGLLFLWGLVFVPLVMVAILYNAWKRPVFGFLVLVIGVPLQELIFARLFSFGIPIGILGLARFWKEALALTLVLRVMIKREQRFDLLDRVGFVYLTLIGVYLVLPIGPALDLRLLGARQVGGFILIFMAARYAQIDQFHIRSIERAILLMGLLLGALAYWNYFDPGGWADWVISNDILGYRRAVSGDTRASLVVVAYGNYGGEQVVRAGSLFLNPLTLPYYLAVPVAISLTRAIRGGANWLTLVVGVVCSGAILLTFTRSAILLMPVIGLVAFTVARNRVRMLVAVILGTLVLGPVVSGTGLGERLWSSFDPEEPSRQVHENRAAASAQRVWERPLGTGLSTAASGSDFKIDPGGRIITENWYLQVGLDMGIPAIVIVVALIVIAIRRLWKRARAGSAIGVSGLCALLWVCLGAIVLQHLADHAVAWSVWLLAGLALREEDPSVLDPQAGSGEVADEEPPESVDAVDLEGGRSGLDALLDRS